MQTVTVPALEKEWFTEIEALWTETMGPLFKKSASTQGTMALQRFNNLIGKASEKRGGNAMGLTGNDAPRFIIEIAFMYTNKTLDAEVLRLSKVFGDRVEALAKKKSVGSVMASKYNPVVMNDAAVDQNVFTTYKDIAKFRQLQKMMDPDGFFRRAGGFKI
jgi:hypothetical protein